MLCANLFSAAGGFLRGKSAHGFPIALWRSLFLIDFDSKTNDGCLVQILLCFMPVYPGALGVHGLWVLQANAAQSCMRFVAHPLMHENLSFWLGSVSLSASVFA